MQANFLHKYITTKYVFGVVVDNNKYTVTVFVNEKGRFEEVDVDADVSDEIQEQIENYLDEHWDELVKQETV